jgi:hypothetical protein
VRSWRDIDRREFAGERRGQSEPRATPLSHLA